MCSTMTTLPPEALEILRVTPGQASAGAGAGEGRVVVEAILNDVGFWREALAALHAAVDAAEGGLLGGVVRVVSLWSPLSTVPADGRERTAAGGWRIQRCGSQ